MPGRPKRFNDAIESKQRSKVLRNGEERKESDTHSEDSKESDRNLQPVPVVDKTIKEPSAPVWDGSGRRGRQTPETPLKHRPLEAHIREEAGAGAGIEKEVQGDLPKAKRETDEHREGPRAGKKAPIGHRLLGWLTRRISKRAFGNKKAGSEMSEPEKTVTEPDTAPVKFIVSKQVRSIILHSVVPLLCVIVFNAIRIAKPEWLWSEDQDQVAVDQITNLINQILIAVSGLMSVIGSARDLNNFRKSKAEAEGGKKNAE